MLTPKKIIKLAYEIFVDGKVLKYPDRNFFTYIHENKSYIIAKNIYSIIYKDFFISYYDNKIGLYDSLSISLIYDGKKFVHMRDSKEKLFSFESFEDAIKTVDDNEIELKINKETILNEN